MHKIKADKCIFHINSVYGMVLILTTLQFYNVANFVYTCKELYCFTSAGRCVLYCIVLFLQGDTILHLAARESLQQAAIFLVTSGASVNLTNKRV